MSTIEDLGYISITEMSPLEGLEHIAIIRISRLTPSIKPSKSKSSGKKKPLPSMTPDQAAELLKLLEATND